MTLVLDAPHRGYVRALVIAAGARAAFVYGSRVRGDVRPGSDLDLAVSGLGGVGLFRLRESLDESPLPMRCDIVDLDSLADGPLRRAIERDGLPLVGSWRDVPDPIASAPDPVVPVPVAGDP